MVHSREDYEAAVEASNILFGKATKENLAKLDEATLLDVFAGVPQYEVNRELFAGDGIKAVDLFAGETACFPSKGEMRKLTQGGGVSMNKEKLNAFDQLVTIEDLLNDKYILAQQGKKKYFLIIVK
jgi:tyrosyl-tRNA synthetase